MFKKSLFLAIVLILATAAFTNAACTAEDAQAKAQVFMNKAMELAQKDAQKYQEVAEAMQTQLPELQKISDFEGLCKFYDEWMAKME